MITHEPCLLPSRVQRGDVGEAEQRLGMRLEQCGAQPWEQPRRAVASAQTPDTVDAVVAECAKKVVAPLRVVAGEISCAGQGMRSDARLPTQRFSGGDRALQLVRPVQRPRWRDQGYPRAGSEEGRDMKHFGTYRLRQARATEPTDRAVTLSFIMRISS